MITNTRRTSQYALSIPAPEHADADVHAALTGLIRAAQAVDLTVTSSWITDDGRLAVAWRSRNDDTARTEARTVLGYAYPVFDHSTAVMFTGYGMHRRDFTLDAA